MAKFILLLRGDPRNWTDLAPHDRERIMGRYMSWSDELRAEGRTVTAEELAEQTSVLLTSADPKGLVIDGPYVETKECVGGFWMITAEDRDDAIRTARGCPGFLHGGTIEVVEVVDHSG